MGTLSRRKDLDGLITKYAENWEISRMAAVDRVAVLAALNLAHELQQLRDEQQARNREVERTLQDLHRKLDSALGTP